MCLSELAIVFTVIDKHAPIKSKRVKKQTKPAWFTEDIQNAIKRRDYLKKQVDLGKVPPDTYNSVRNKVVHMVEKAKSESIKRELEDNSRNPRLLWKALKKLCPMGKSRLTDDHLNDASRNEHFNSRQEANNFNLHSKFQSVQGTPNRCKFTQFRCM